MSNVQVECLQSLPAPKLKRATSIAGITPHYRDQRSRDLRYKPYPQPSRGRHRRNTRTERSAGVVDSQLNPRHSRRRFGSNWTMRSMAEMLENKLTLGTSVERGSGAEPAEDILRDQGKDSSEEYYNTLSVLEEDANPDKNSSDIPKHMTPAPCGPAIVELDGTFGGQPGYGLISAARSLPRVGGGERPGTRHRPSSHTRRFPLVCPPVQMPTPYATPSGHNWNPTLVLDALTASRNPDATTAEPILANESQDLPSLMEEWMKEDDLLDKSQYETTINIFNVSAADFCETAYASEPGTLRDSLWPVTSARADDERCMERAGVASSQPRAAVDSGENTTDSGNEKENRDINHLRKQKTFILSEDNERERDGDPFSCLGEIKNDQNLWSINETPQDQLPMSSQRIFIDSLTNILRENSLSDIFCHEVNSDSESLTNVLPANSLSDIFCHEVSSDPTCCAHSGTEGDYKNLIPSQNNFRCQICDDLMETEPFINVCRDEREWLESPVLGSGEDLDLYCPQCGCSRRIFNSCQLPDFTENTTARLAMGHETPRPAMRSLNMSVCPVPTTSRCS